MSEHFADRLIAGIKKKSAPICVGLDPRLDRIPGFIKSKILKDGDLSATAAAAEAVLVFNKGIIDAVADIVPAVKLQIAFYEIFGYEGVRVYEESLKYAKSKGLLTIADAKRNDIGSTAEAYSRAFLGEVEMFSGDNEVVVPIFDADSLTVTPYLGWDGIKPFVEECNRYDKGIFVLVKTSNPSSGDLQDLKIESGETVYEILGHLVESWGEGLFGKESGYSFVGAVVGATYPYQAKVLRNVMPKSIFLVPGYGVQGGTADDVRACFNDDGLGAIVNSSRGIIFAYEGSEKFGEEGFAEVAREAAIDMKEDLERVLN